MAILVGNWIILYSFIHLGLIIKIWIKKSRWILLIGLLTCLSPWASHSLGNYWLDIRLRIGSLLDIIASVIRSRVVLSKRPIISKATLIWIIGHACDPLGTQSCKWGHIVTLLTHSHFILAGEKWVIAHDCSLGISVAFNIEIAHYYNKFILKELHFKN